MDQSQKMPLTTSHGETTDSSEYRDPSPPQTEDTDNSSRTMPNQARPDSPFPTVADMINNMPPSSDWDPDSGFEAETVYYLDSPSLSTASIENDYDTVSDVDIPYWKSKSTEDAVSAARQSTESDTKPKTATLKKAKSTFERGPPLCEANMFGPLDWGLELMGRKSDPETEPEGDEHESETLSYPHRSIIEEVSYDGAVIYTIRRDIDERVHWPGTPA